MQNKPILVMAAGVLGGLTAVVLCVAAALTWENQSLRTKLADSRRAASEASAQIAGLKAGQAATTSDLAEHQQDIQDLRRQVVSLRAAAADATDSVASATFVPAKLFAGNRYLGQAWVRPAAGNTSGGATADSATVVVDPNLLDPEEDTTASPTRGNGYGPGFTYVRTYYQYPAYLWTSGWIDWGGATNPACATPPQQPPVVNPPPPPPPPTEPAVAKGWGPTMARADSLPIWRTRVPRPTPPGPVPSPPAVVGRQSPSPRLATPTMAQSRAVTGSSPAQQPLPRVAGQSPPILPSRR